MTIKGNVFAPTYECKIYTGLKEGYDGSTHSIEEVQNILQYYCDDVGLCVTLTPTKYIYQNGFEEGCIIGLINYPRYIMTNETIKRHAIKIGDMIRVTFKQYRVSVVCSDETILIGNP